MAEGHVRWCVCRGAAAIFMQYRCVSVIRALRHNRSYYKRLKYRLEEWELSESAVLSIVETACIDSLLRWIVLSEIMKAHIWYTKVINHEDNNNNKYYTMDK